MNMPKMHGLTQSSYKDIERLKDRGIISEHDAELIHIYHKIISDELNIQSASNIRMSYATKKIDSIENKYLKE